MALQMMSVKTKQKVEKEFLRRKVEQDIPRGKILGQGAHVCVVGERLAQPVHRPLVWPGEPVEESVKDSALVSGHTSTRTRVRGKVV